MSFHFIAKKPSRQIAPGVLAVWKARGETLAELIARIRLEEGIAPKEKVTYAGRLDPMAEGLVLLLVGEARFAKEAYSALSKTYEVEVLFGIATDSLDALGRVQHIDTNARIDKARISGAVEALRDVVSLPYPMYSSRPVGGIPLFAHARAGRSVAVPQKKVQITEAVLLEVAEKPLSSLAAEAIEVIERVAGDFRQEVIISDWKEAAHRSADAPVTLARVRISASSGTYMRSLAALLGERLGISAIAFRITRTNVGAGDL